MPSWDEAIEEAYASAPADEYVIETLELLHPAFVDEESPPGPDSIRVALDDRSWTLELEAAAPLKGGQSVQFDPLAMRITLPEQAEGQLGTMRLSLDNVPLQYLRRLQDAVGVRATALLIYREWRAIHDPETGAYSVSGPPSLILGDLTVKIVQANLTTIEASASFFDWLNRGFPRARFTRELYPALFGG